MDMSQRLSVKKRYFKLKVSPKFGYGLPYIYEISSKYHIRLRTNIVRGQNNNDFEIFYGKRTTYFPTQIMKFSQNPRNVSKTTKYQLKNQ